MPAAPRAGARAGALDYRAAPAELPNAERTAPRRAARQAERDREPEIMATGDPGIDLLDWSRAGSSAASTCSAVRARASGCVIARHAGPDRGAGLGIPTTAGTIEAARTGPLRAALVDHGLGGAGRST
ncbi:MAG: hypothetical protein U1E17_01575 [Geminicoccaceae bacterium]